MVSTTAAERALSLAELFTDIASYLEPAHIQTCRRVNRQWSHFLGSFFWRRVTLTSSKPTPPALWENKHHIRYLLLKGNYVPLLDNLSGLIQLKDLSLDTYNHPLPLTGQRRTSLKSFVQEHSSRIQTLSIQHVVDNNAATYNSRISITYLDDIDRNEALNLQHMIEVLGTEGSWDNLETLGVSAGHLSERTTETLWWFICKFNVKDLRLSGISSPEEVWSRMVQGSRQSWGESLGLEPLSSTFSQVKKLTVDRNTFKAMSRERNVDILRCCPLLEELSCNWVQAFSQASFQQELKRGRWPRLKSVRGLFSDSVFTDWNIAGLIAGMQKVENLVLIASGFSTSAFKALVEHPTAFSELRELDLAACASVTSQMIQGILQGSKRLEVFQASVALLVQHVFARGSQPWPCAPTLRSFKVDLVRSITPHANRGAEDEQVYFEQNRAMLERISTMVNLRHLTCLSGGACPGYICRDGRYVDFTLEGGLDQLGNLTGLTVVNFEGGSGMMGKKELDWILTHWPKLVYLRMRLPETEEGLTPEQTSWIEAKGLQLFLVKK